MEKDGMTTEQLDAIIEAGKRMKDAGRLSNEYWRARDVYEPLAINHADALAAEVKRLREERKRIGEMLGPLDTCGWEDKPFMRIRVTIPEARELAELVKPQ